MANEYRITAFYIEVLDDSPSKARVTTYPIEVLHSGQLTAAKVRVTSNVIEVLHGGQLSVTFARATLFAIEVLRSTALLVATSAGRAAQIIG